MSRFSAVICGGGIAGVEALLHLRQLAGRGIEVTLLSPEAELVYHPLTVLEPFTGHAAQRYPISRIVEDTGADWLQDSLGWLDRDQRTVHTCDGRQVRYDALLLAIGAPERAPSAHLDVFTRRDGGRLYREILQDIEEGRISELAFLMPPDPVWPLPLYELALLTAKHARDHGMSPYLSFIIPGHRPLQVFGDDVGELLAQLLSDAGIALHTDTGATVASPHRLVLRPSGAVLNPDRIISLPVLTGPDVRGIPGFALDRFLHVDEYCRVLDTDGRIFAAGDATHLPVKQGGVGAQQADVAAAGIAHLAGLGPRPGPLRPQINATLLTGDAPLYLSAYLIGGQGWRAELHDQPPWPAGQKIIAAELGPYLDTLDTFPSRDQIIDRSENEPAPRTFGP